MLFRVGAGMMLFSVSLAVAVAAFVSLRSEAPATMALSAETQAVETTAQENKGDLDEKLEIEERPQGENKPQKEQSRHEKPLKASYTTDWPIPEASELKRLEEPRYFEPVFSAAMTLTVEALGLYDVPVISSDSLEALDIGVVHVPGTSFPWDGGAQRNVYLAGHRLGYPETGSRLVFYELDRLRRGDKIILEDRGGRVYEYQVSEAFEAGPNDYEVMDQVLGRDLLTLQTCTGPNFEKRLIVRADRV